MFLRDGKAEKVGPGGKFGKLPLGLMIQLYVVFMSINSKLCRISAWVNTVLSEKLVAAALVLSTSVCLSKCNRKYANR